MKKTDEKLKQGMCQMGKKAIKKALSKCNIHSVSKCDNPHCIDGVVDEIYGEKIYCSICQDK